MVVTELRGEKIDIVPFSEDSADFVAKALSPAKVKEVRIHEDTGVAEVIVPDYQLSLAIGKEGQNARLAARLTGWRVDIKSETQLADEEAGIFPVAEDDVEYAEGEWVANPDTGEHGVALGRGRGRDGRGVGRRRRRRRRCDAADEAVVEEAVVEEAVVEEAAGSRRPSSRRPSSRRQWPRRPSVEEAVAEEAVVEEAVEELAVEEPTPADDA